MTETPSPCTARAGAKPLTPAQTRVVRLLCEGLLDKQIADRLGVAPRTVSNHLEHITKRIGLKGRVRVAVWAVREGIA